MTSEQKEQITLMRRQSMGYTEIANTLGIPKDTVKTFCRRNKLGGILASPEQYIDRNTCLECGAAIVQVEKQKTKKFCCKECRQKWWKEHPEKLSHRNIRSCVCESCGKPFTSYGNITRKYCCHSCYITARFKGGVARDK